MDRLFELAVLPLHFTATAGFCLFAIPQLAWAQCEIHRATSKQPLCPVCLDETQEPK